MPDLLIGCGNSRQKRIVVKGRPESFQELVTLDSDPFCKPTHLHDLNDLPLPFPSNTFDEIHAYEVLEHVGRQGDYRSFFGLFQELWRILKPGGLLCATTPAWNSIWAWSDPGHTRIISHGSLVFLSQAEYERQVGKTPMTDYRGTYGGNFSILSATQSEHTFQFVLKAIK